jgi:hypothetical protein
MARPLGNLVFAAIALLVVTVGVLATESGLPKAGRNSASCHTSKSSRMTELDRDELAPAQTADSRSSPFIVTSETDRFHCDSPDLLPRGLGAAPQAHGLRAPPLV